MTATTVTTYQLTLRNRTQGWDYQVQTDKLPQDYLVASHAELVAAERLVLTVEPGTPVQVSAFGRLRKGTVVKVNRTTATVDFIRNASGDVATRTFRLAYLLPGLGASFTRETVAL